MTKSNSLGVIIGRFQCVYLHEGYVQLINHVKQRHSKVLIVLGSPRSYPTNHDPLSYNIRNDMLRSQVSEIFPEDTTIFVDQILDTPSDKTWSTNLDKIISKHSVYYGETSQTILYGSRDSFLKTYTGRYKTEYFETINTESSTLQRERLAKYPSVHERFRHGIIYSVMNRPPLVYPTVDVAIYCPERKAFLMGHKNQDGDKLRFVGGFVDPTDESLEYAARRERSEEITGIEVDNYRFIGSTKINDWRYRNTKDGIMTSFFLAQYIFGHPEPGDDLDGVEWLPLEKYMGTSFLPYDMLVDNHIVLAAMLPKDLHEKGFQNG
jgi:bifunctional NMN adenylyltransferase/nudix hydrolase